MTRKSTVSDRKAKVLIFRLGGLGDLLVVLPGLNVLRALLPDREISLVCREDYGRLFVHFGLVHSLISVDSPALRPLFSASPHSPKIRFLMGEYALILGWMQKPAAFFQELREVVSDRTAVHSLVFDPAEGKSVSRFFYEETRSGFTAEDVTLPSFEDCAVLPPEVQDEGGGGRAEMPSTPPSKFAVVHPGSGSERKCWPLDHFLHLIRKLSRRGFQGVLVTGEAEVRLDDLLRARDLPFGWERIHNPRLEALVRLLRRADVYMGNDSGITHLAAASGTPGLAFFLEEYLPAWKPFGRIQTLSRGQIRRIDPEEAWEILTERILLCK